MTAKHRGQSPLCMEAAEFAGSYYDVPCSLKRILAIDGFSALFLGVLLPSFGEGKGMR